MIIGDPLAGLLLAGSDKKSDDSSYSLTNSYKTLFKNIDYFTDDKCNNNNPKYLKVITLSGLPVEEIPFIEIYSVDYNNKNISESVSKLVYTSHSDLTLCRWMSEEGEGFFRVGIHLTGDFMIVCRFGGELAEQRDKSTLIFKYQNSMAFINNYNSDDNDNNSLCIDLTHSDIDINNRYLHSFDFDQLKLGLIFTHKIYNSFDYVDNNKLDIPKFNNLESIDWGLLELSTNHIVQTDVQVRYI